MGQTGKPAAPEPGALQQVDRRQRPQWWEGGGGWAEPALKNSLNRIHIPPLLCSQHMSEEGKRQRGSPGTSYCAHRTSGIADLGKKFSSLVFSLLRVLTIITPKWWEPLGNKISQNHLKRVVRDKNKVSLQLYLMTLAWLQLKWLSNNLMMLVLLNILQHDT